MTETTAEKQEKTETMTETTIPETMPETMTETTPEIMTEATPEATPEKVYSYTYTHMRKDGTVRTYTKEIKYKPEKKTKEITEEMMKEIIHKWKLGVPKAKLKREYDLTQSQINRILLTINPKKNNEIINNLTEISNKLTEITDLLNKLLKVNNNENKNQPTESEVN